MKIDESVISGAKALLERAKKIVITNHVNPDGDAMGSALGLQRILKNAGWETTVVVPNSYPSFLEWMEGHDEVVVFEDEQGEAEKLLREADLLFHLDYNALKRSGPMVDILENLSISRIVIDHHQEPDHFAEVLYSDPTMSSTAEMIYHFACTMGWEKLVDLKAAECLYTGIMTDTGNFRFSGTSPGTHRIAAEFLSIGVLPHVIAGRIYDTNTPSRLQLLGTALERMEVLPEYRTAILTLTGPDLQKAGYQKGDTEGFVNYGLSIEGVVLSVFCYPRDEVVKMSFRSKGDFNVNLLAREHFRGGGHVNAAGGISELTLEETVDKIKNILPQYEKLIHAVEL